MCMCERIVELELPDEQAGRGVSPVFTIIGLHVFRVNFVTVFYRSSKLLSGHRSPTPTLLSCLSRTDLIDPDNVIIHVSGQSRVGVYLITQVH